MPQPTNADELKNSGLKATLPRIKILDVFQRTQQRHMTAEDVFKALPIPEKPAATPTEAIGPTRSYPPLEAAR